MAAAPPQALDDQDMNRRFSGISYLVGNTPLLAIDCVHGGRTRTVYAKAENLKLAGGSWVT